MALNRKRQTHLEVPSSNEPVPGEWGKALWYICRLAALQANPTISEEDAKRLVNYFECLHFVIPCPECRGHYKTYYAAHPYTVEHASNTLSSMTWVEDLRGDVDARIAAEKAAKGIPASSVKNATAPQRKYAIKSALHLAQMNHIGVKIGCNCGKGKTRP